LILSEYVAESFPDDSLIAAGDGVWDIIKIKAEGEEDTEEEAGLGFSESGIMVSLSQPLCKERACFFYVSTWFTDYLLVDESDYTVAKNALVDDGWIFE